jgi:membrane-associated protease RseP (regulator of RpoE activity)
MAILRLLRLATLVLCHVVVALLASGCAAVFPELPTKFSKAPDLGTFDPPPPPDRLRIRVLSGKVPAKTRDGRDWDQTFGSKPHPYAVILVNKKEVLRTDPQVDAYEPTWPDGPKGNFALAPGDKVEAQLWHDSTLSDTPIGVQERTLTPDLIEIGEMRFELSGGGELVLEVKPAEAIWGAGFWFELRNDSVVVTRLIDGSPASRADLRPGDRIVSIDGKALVDLPLPERRSLLGSFPAKGYALALERKDGSTLQVELKEGPIYPLFGDYARLPVKP